MNKPSVSLQLNSQNTLRRLGGENGGKVRGQWGGLLMEMSGNKCEEVQKEIGWLEERIGEGWG